MLLAQVEIQFEPPFVFPGERFSVAASAGAELSADGVPLRRSGNHWVGTAPPKPVDFWATVGPPGAYTDAARKTIPVAETHGMPMGGGMVIVPMYGGAYGAIVRGKRYAEAVEFTLSARSAPLRKREFRVDYVYEGPTRVTLYGTAEGVLRAAVSFTPDSVDIHFASLFDTAGSVRILDHTFRFDLKPGETGSFTSKLPLGGAP